MNELLKGLDMKVTNLSVTIRTIQMEYAQSQIELRKKNDTIEHLVDIVAARMISPDETQIVWEDLFGKLGGVIDAHIQKERKIEAIKMARLFLNLSLTSAAKLVEKRIIYT